MCHHFSQSHYGLRSPFPAGLFQYERVTWSGAGLVNPKFYPTLSKIETRKLQEADPGWLISATTSSLNYRRGASPITHSKRPGEPYSICFVSPHYTSYPLPACLKPPFIWNRVWPWGTCLTEENIKH
jgi:hypothetical protein